MTIPSGAIPYAAIFGMNDTMQTSSLRDFVERHMDGHPTSAAAAFDASGSEAATARGTPPYIFYEGIADVAPALLEDFPILPNFLQFPSDKLVQKTPSAIQWYLGVRILPTTHGIACPSWRS